MSRKTTLTWLALALLTLGSVGDLGTAPATAVFGLASVVLYVIPAIVFLVPASLVYVLMFVAAGKLRRGQPDHQRGYRAPALVTICVVGTLASLAACVIGLVPPSQLGQVSTPIYAVAMFAGVLVIGVLPPVLLHRFRRPGWKVG